MSFSFKMFALIKAIHQDVVTPERPLLDANTIGGCGVCSDLLWPFTFIYHWCEDIFQMRSIFPYVRCDSVEIVAVGTDFTNDAVLWRKYALFLAEGFVEFTSFFPLKKSILGILFLMLAFTFLDVVDAHLLAGFIYFLKVTASPQFLK